MEKTILSLKNIYTMLIAEDFPVYSESVIGRNDRRGLTMLRFWQGQMAGAFRCLPCGQMLWRNDGKRNRYTSYLCNRSAEIKIYPEYARELASQISVSSLRDQTGRFMEFLSARNYRHDTLLRRVRELVRLTEAEDPRVSRDIAAQLLETADWQTGGTRDNLFKAAYLLTLLTLYAAAGEAMDDHVMAVLRRPEFGIEALWTDFTQPEEAAAAPAGFLTLHSGLLQDNPLPAHRFFGREDELFNLKEAAAAGRKCLITGIGGMGKTELLRQLIQVCQCEKIVEKIAVVPYEGSITESFARCFPGLQQQNREDSFRAALHRLTKESAQGSVLLLIDNLSNGPDEDPELRQLADLPCGILVTSRRPTLEGFEICSLDPPTMGTGALIFRDNYGYPLRREDRTALETLLADEILRHPLTLRLMARAARIKGWSVEELRNRLERQDAALTWQEEEGTVRLSQVYRQLYSYMRIPEECRQIAELFTLLPRDSYAPEFLREWFPWVVDGDSGGKLDALVEGGWLDQDTVGYSMHPLIAQCLRRKVLTEERIGPMTEFIQRRMLQMKYGATDLEFGGDTAPHRAGKILLYAVSFLSGNVSRGLLHAVLKAIIIQQVNMRFKKTVSHFADQMMRRCRDKDDEIHLLYLVVQCDCYADMGEAYLSAYRTQKQTLKVPKFLFYLFCVKAGMFALMTRNAEEAEMYLTEVISGEAEPEQKASAYYYLYYVPELCGSRERGLEIAVQGAQYAMDHPECGTNNRFRLLCAACTAQVCFGRREEAFRSLCQLRELLPETQYSARGIYEGAAGTYELYFGDPEKAWNHYRNACVVFEELQGKEINYYSAVGQGAIALQRMKRYEEAVACYLEILEFAQKENDASRIQLFRNNISVAYLEMERPRDALEYLNANMEFSRQLGGIALGEAQRNRARAFRQLGDTEQEYACLQEAAPLLNATYGPDHPRSVAARERLAALEKQYAETPPFPTASTSGEGH